MRAGDQIGLYRLEALVAEGGMGSVWRAHHPTLDRHVAIKFVRRDASENEHAREAFMREVRHLSKLHGPQILQIQDFGFTEAGDPYMVTEFLEGEDLLSRLKTVGTIDVRQALYIGVEVLKALGEAHAMGLVHRDLKPGNIFLQSLAGGARTAIKVLDFGVAKLIFGEDSESTLWPTGSPKGSPRYMSPEQILDEPVTPASDFYAFGATLYRALCGEPVFGGSIAVMIQAHIEASPQPLRDRFPRLGIPPRLDELLLQCLAKAPADRPSDAEALQVEFERLLQSSPGGQSFPSPEESPDGGPDSSSPPAVAPAASDGRAGALLIPVAKASPLEVPSVNLGVDPLEHTGQPLSMNEPTPSIEASETSVDGASASEDRSINSARAPQAPIRVQSAQRSRPQGVRWELLLSALVLVVGACGPRCRAWSICRISGSSIFAGMWTCC